MNFLGVAAVLGFLAVGLGAFGAHGLRDRLDAPALDVYRTAALYHLLHAVALLALALVPGRVRGQSAVCWLFAGGVIVFSGSLYLLAVTGVRWLGAVTPIGGMALLAGWLLLAIGAVRGREPGN